MLETQITNINNKLNKIFTILFYLNIHYFQFLIKYIDIEK